MVSTHTPLSHSVTFSCKESWEISVWGSCDPSSHSVPVDERGNKICGTISHSGTDGSKDGKSFIQQIFIESQVGSKMLGTRVTEVK